jgi:thiol-disulfide isomerase/thioredoxin
LAFAFALVLAAVCPTWAADAQPATKAAPVTTLAVRLVDSDHKAVSGAHVGTFAYSSQRPRRPADESGLMYFDHCVSNQDGFAKFPSKRSALADPRGHVQIVARHVGRSLIALADLDSADSRPLVEMTVVPECRISGKIVCPDLTKIGHNTGATIVFLSMRGVQMMSCTSESGELPGNNLARLMGHTAPELRDVAAWKNGPPLKLAALKGKCVLLEFWGYWCGPCIHRMPETFKLFDQYGKQGLVVIGVHVDFPDGKVDSVEKLDANLVETRKKRWHGRDVPFPVAITRHLDEKGAAVADDYGIHAYPTLLLIDRRGSLVDIMPPGPEGLALLQNALNEPAAATGTRRPLADAAAAPAPAGPESSVRGEPR